MYNRNRNATVSMFVDSISIPDFSAGAMENWGLVTYRETRLLFDPLYMTTYQKQRFSGTIGHELLHMVGTLIIKWKCSQLIWWFSIDHNYVYLTTSSIFSNKFQCQYPLITFRTDPFSLDINVPFSSDNYFPLSGLFLLISITDVFLW